MKLKQTAAWMIHLYTIAGGVLGMFALVVAGNGDYRGAFLLMLLTTLIDATDGLMARQIKIWEVLPGFDGSMVDNVIDTLTFLWLPVFIMVHGEFLPHPAWLVVPVVAGLYVYGQVNMKSEDSFFLGFPSYWNIVALYMFWLEPMPFWAVMMVVVPGVLSFVPTRYLYPSKNRVLWKTSWSLGSVWLLLLVYLLSQAEPSRDLVLLSLFYPIYYMVASFWVDSQIRLGAIRERRGSVPPPVDEAAI